jgi:hypothetical protein
MRSSIFAIAAVMGGVVMGGATATANCLSLEESNIGYRKVDVKNNCAVRVEYEVICGNGKTHKNSVSACRTGQFSVAGACGDPKTSYKVRAQSYNKFCG